MPVSKAKCDKECGAVMHMTGGRHRTDCAAYEPETFTDEQLRELMQPSRTPLQRIWSEIDDALAPANARRFDGDNNYKKRIDIRTGIVGSDDDGSPVFVLDVRSPRSVVNDLFLSIQWDTNERAEAAAFLRKLADKIENGATSREKQEPV